ncbi:MAG: hypothetical protein Q4E11_07190 [Corynebacterium sp.]|uniref:hypothetical protein n=1 Tax=Corynebacterium sp. TaxID=1720 RepID=UPI0026DB0154|nr:hypothetical protein [Corynebacterium sp.]MDO5030354.1 hypothetical protein [Corynebacterium sp.]
MSKRLSRIALTTAMAATLGLSACTIGGGDEAATPSPTLDDGSSGNSSREATAPGELPRKVIAAVEDVQEEYGGIAGVAVATPGKDSNVADTGEFTTGPAWSTSKVPVSIAAVRQYGMTPQVEAAITISDNDAAEATWYSLGDDATAGATTDEILREGGDESTVMGTDRVREQYTVFGQTQWDLDDQAVFGANMQCIEAGPEVAELMGQIADEQAYGLGHIPNAHFKGGWGPDDEGIYLVRQFGFIPGEKPGTFIGIAIAAQPDDGSYETGQEMLNDIAKAIADSDITAGRAGSC